MDLSLSQLPKIVNGGPLVYYEPDTVGTEDAVEEASNEQIVEAIRAVTDPAVAKRSIDAKIVELATRNRVRAEKALKALDVPFAPRSAAMSGLWSWLTGTSNLSDLSRYSAEDREVLKKYFVADTYDVIEKTFTQDELDTALAKIKTGAPANVAGALVDPYPAATASYQQGVVSTLAPMGTTATSTGGSAAKIVADGIIGLYRKGSEAPGRVFDWLGKAKWLVLLSLVGSGVGAYYLWPKIKASLVEKGAIGEKFEALKNLLGG